ncbi:hypothetical protein [Haloferula sp. A504]|uniref:hypothetical protein n=1 Tax=Haloferula sp. A504 TaxID=3373601 RepID=UPI0031C8B7A7|nr:hypothetical protein [Verrucomicrobiaceae bacterium E54]
MKTLTLITLLALPALAGEMRDIASQDQLGLKLRMSEQQDPMKNLKVVEADDPTEAARPEDLMASSEVLSFNGIATLVPKGAVLAVPANLRCRTGFQPGARLVPWNEFFAVNRGWIQTIEVSFDQAAGRAELPEGLRKQLEESRVVVIATMRQGPITVNPYKPSAEGADPQTAAR